MTVFEKLLVLHLIGDWLLQNDWMAKWKSDLRHPAAWVHGAIHGGLITLVVGWKGGVLLAVLHMLVDTRVPQRWWSRVFRQSQTGEMASHVMVWGDQVIHIATLAAWVTFAPRFGLA